jgi:hypothetical protein
MKFTGLQRARNGVKAQTGYLVLADVFSHTSFAAQE